MLRGYAGRLCGERRYTQPPRRSATMACAERRMLRVLRVMTLRSRLGGKAGLLDEAAPFGGIALQEIGEVARSGGLRLQPELLREIHHLPLADRRPDRVRGALHRFGARLARHEEGVPL